MNYWRTFFILLITVVILLIFSPLSGRWNQPAELSPYLTDTLAKLGAQAAERGDVPVASILIYDDLIVGSGANDVIDANKAGGHAEINAISAALNVFGYKKFMKLDRKRLRLITTFEPCPMCRGAIAEYQIHDIRVLKYKSLHTHWYDWSQTLRAYFNSTPIDAGNLQDSLFKLVPGFDSTNARY